MRMLSSKLALATAACTLFIIGCEQAEQTAQAQTATAAQSPSAPAAAASAADAGAKVLATVDGKPITQALVDTYMRLQMSARPGTPVDEHTLINNLVGLQLLAEDAKQKGLNDDPTVQAQMEFQRLNILGSAALRELLASHTFSEAEIKQEYDRLVGNAPGKEYKASHILVNSEDEAKEVIKSLEQGKDFAALAKEKSTDASAQQGGDLGWFAPQQMVEPFGQAVASLAPGSYTKSPVQSEFGWHVIKLDEVRDVQPPALESVKSQVESVLQNKLVNDYVAELKAKAKIEVPDAPAEPAKAEQPAATPEQSKASDK